MENFLVINNTNKAIEWFLGTFQIRGEHREICIVQQEACIYLGIHAIVKMILKWGLQRTNHYEKVYELNKALDFYYNCLVIGKPYMRPNSMDESLKLDLENYIGQEAAVISFLQQKGVLKLTVGKECINLSYALFEQTILKDIKETLGDAIKDWMKAYVLEIPKQVVLKGGWSECQWYQAILQEVLKSTTISYEYLEIEKKQLVDRVITSSNQDHNKVMTQNDEIVLRYLDKEIVLVNTSQIEDSKFKSEYTFEIAFSLHPHITIDILKRYKQEGRYKYEMLASANLFHPLFYTGDEIKVLVNRDIEGYKIKFIHVETKLERSVLATYRK